jgi:hypothetical protein
MGKANPQRVQVVEARRFQKNRMNSIHRGATGGEPLADTRGAVTPPHIRPQTTLQLRKKRFASPPPAVKLHDLGRRVLPVVQQGRDQPDHLPLFTDPNGRLKEAQQQVLGKPRVFPTVACIDRQPAETVVAAVGLHLSIAAESVGRHGQGARRAQGRHPRQRIACWAVALT